MTNHDHSLRAADDEVERMQYIRNDADEQLNRMIRTSTETETSGETMEGKTGTDEGEAVENKREKVGGSGETA